MNDKNVIVKSDGPILRITVNRPQKLNALNRKTVAALNAAFHDQASRDAIRVVILTGVGDKAFVAGADISEIQNLDPTAARAYVRAGQKLMNDIENLGKPVIAAINGYALGGGCELALASTIRLATSTASLGLPEINLGILPGFGGTQRLGRLIGAGRAMHMTLSGEMISAEQALDWGLISGMFEPRRFTEAVDKLAGKLARSAPHAMHAIIDLINRGMELPIESGLQIEADRFALCCATHDMREGTSAFLQKRKPEFKGN
jgi:enoyl-CoA hydratase